MPSYCFLCWAVPSLVVLQQIKAGFGEVASLGAWLLLRNHNTALASSTSVFRWLFLQGSAPSCAAGMDRAQVFPGFPQGVPLTSPFKGIFHLWEELAGSSLEVALCLFREAILFLLQTSMAGRIGFAWPGLSLPRQKHRAGPVFGKN